MMELIWLGIHLFGFVVSAGSVLLLLFFGGGKVADGAGKKLIWAIRGGLSMLLVSGFALVASWSSALHNPLFLVKLGLVAVIAASYGVLELRLRSRGRRSSTPVSAVAAKELSSK